MAEAPQGPPRKTSTYNQFEGMASENERYNVKPNEMFWLENIMRTAPHKLKSVPGPGSATRFPIVNPCQDSTERGQQNIAIETAFDQTTFAPGNLRTSWATVQNGELISLVGEATCGGGNMNYFAFALPPPTLNCSAQYHFPIDNGGGPDSAVAPVAEDATIAAINTSLGTSDVPVYTTGGFGSTAFGLAYPNDNVRVGYNTLFQTTAFHPFAVRADRMWLAANNATTNLKLFEYNRLGGGSPLNTYQPWGTDSVQINNMNLTSDRLICIVANSTTGKQSIDQVDTTTGTIAHSTDISSVAGIYLFAVNNNLIYFLAGGLSDPKPLYYIDSTDTVTYVGKASGSFASAFSGTGYFNNGTYYFGGNGFGGDNINVRKIVVQCPPATGPVIATISVAPSSVVAGGSVTATFGRILLPDSTDRIQLATAPAAGELGFVGPTATFISTGSAPTGVLPFTIPGGTTPGDYVLQLVTQNGNVYIAKSNTFTVT